MIGMAAIKNFIWMTSGGYMNTTSALNFTNHDMFFLRMFTSMDLGFWIIPCMVKWKEHPEKTTTHMFVKWLEDVNSRWIPQKGGLKA